MEKSKKLKPVEAVARIKIAISKYFEDMGRKGDPESFGKWIETLEQIELVLDNTDLPEKYLVAESILQNWDNFKEHTKEA